jgi:hypothetical protein
MINRTEILATVDAIATSRLFGRGKWLVGNPRTATALNEMLQTLGLEELLPDGISSRCTSLGKELNSDLQQVFMGLWEPWDAVHVLKDYDLVAEDEVDTLLDLLEIGEKYYEPLLRARVQQAYRDYYKATLLH